MECELSIIVPVFNAQQYIARTVDRLLTQQTDRYEIILVDDGSTDNSPSICNELSDRHRNIKVFHIKNSGPGSARNFGISHSHGKYIAFCDSDDLPAPNMYGLLLNDLRQQNVDYAICDIFSERDNRAFGFPWSGNIKLIGREVIDKLLASMLGNLSDNDVTPPIWGSSVRCIYLKDIITDNKIKFPADIRFAEDLVFNIRYIRHIDSCYIRNEALYRYTFNHESLMNSHVKYNKTGFIQRIALVNMISTELYHIPDNSTLIRRFQTSQRCYFLEMIGNAARAISQEGHTYALKEIRSIVNHPIVKSAFAVFDAKSIKTSASYWLIQHRCARILLRYFSLRLKNGV